MKRAAGYLVAMLCIGGCATSADGPTPGASVFRVDRIDRASDGMPYYVHGTLGAAAGPIRDLRDVDAALAPALVDVGRAIGVPAEQLVAARVSHDEIGMTHVIYDQRAHDLPVVGGRVALHLAADGTITAVTTSARDITALPTVPAIAPSYAADLAQRTTADGVADAGTPALVYLIANAEGDTHLAWQVEVTARHRFERDRVFVDAVSGEVVARHPEIYPVKNRAVLNGNGGVYPGVSPTADGDEATPPTETIAMAAFDNTGITYDCYHDLFQRDSYDNAGAQLTSIVHVVFDNGAGGTTGDNAFWDGQEMVYGDGDGGNEFSELARALDVTAHELTHAVTESSAGLNYQRRVGRPQRGEQRHHGCGLRVAPRGCGQREHVVGRRGHLHSEHPGDALRYMSNPTQDAPIYNGQTCSADYYPERDATE